MSDILTKCKYINSDYMYVYIYVKILIYYLWIYTIKKL